LIDLKNATVANLTRVIIRLTLNKRFDPFAVDRSWQSRAWNGFNNEQQATIVNEWFRLYSTDLNSFEALNDPAFHFIRDNIRAGVN
jgi:hypothetical protein